MCSNKEALLWHTMVPGNKMNSRVAMDGVQDGDTDSIKGVSDGITYNLWAMKEPKYVMKMMVTGCNFIVNSTGRRTIYCWIEDGVETMKEFAYILPFDWHFRYHHAIDDHNNLCCSLPSIKESWITQHWECPVLSFILTIIKVNAFLCICHAKGKENFPSWVNFHRQLGWEMVLNPHLIQIDDDDNQNVPLDGGHNCIAALRPRQAFEYRNHARACTTKQRYQ